MGNELTNTHSQMRQIAGWGVHAYTGLGLPLAVLAAGALYKGEAVVFFLILMLTSFIDATDGAMARAVKVKEVVPQFDGALLDNIVDFLTFTFLPALALPVLGIIPENMWYIAAVPVMASGYGFCQSKAKTDDAFVGFPSYWNVVVFYLWLLEIGPMINVACIIVLSVLVFVPIHYIYPSKTLMLRRTTLLLGGLWTLILLALCLRPHAPWAYTLALCSLLYPLYYTVVSAVHHVRVHRRASHS